MFILKLGAEALSLKSESFEHKSKESGVNCNDHPISVSHKLSGTNGRMLESLLKGCLVESALLSDVSATTRCRSAINPSTSTFVHKPTSKFSRPRSETVPRSSFISQNKPHSFNNPVVKRKLHSDAVDNGILFPSLSKQTKADNDALVSPRTSIVNSNIMSPGITRLNNSTTELTLSSSPAQPTYSTISTDEMKRLRQQINILLKKIMQIIKSYSNFASMSESRRLDFVSNLWHKIMLLAILQMDTQNSRFMFRWLLLSIFNGNNEVGCSRRDKVLLLEKLQEYMKSYFWLKTNTELLHCILFWFFAKYGYSDAFFMSPQAVLCKLKDLVISKSQFDSILKLIHELSEITENQKEQPGLLGAHTLGHSDGCTRHSRRLPITPNYSGMSPTPLV